MTSAGSLRAGGYLLGYVALAFVGRATMVGSDHLPLVWPAAGLGVLWLLSSKGWFRVIDPALMVAGMYVVSISTRLSTQWALVTCVAELGSVVVGAELLRRMCPELCAPGGPDVHDLRTFGRYVFALLVAAVDGTALVVVGALLSHAALTADTTYLWLGRTGAGLLGVSALGLTVQGWWRSKDRSLVSRASPGGRVELGALVLATGAAYWVSFDWTSSTTVFPLIVFTVWAGARFSPLVNAAHSVAVGVAVTAFTLSGRGPFTQMSGPYVGMILAQTYIIMVLVIGLALAIGRVERAGLAGALAVARDDAVDQADLMARIVESMAEGLVVVEDDGEVVMSSPAASRVLGVHELPRTTGGLRTYHLDGRLMAPNETPEGRALAGETVAAAELLFLDGDDGRRRVMLVSAAPLARDRTTGRSRAVMVFRDVTDDHARRTELANFAGVVAHDLTGPLAALEGWANLAGESIADEQEVSSAALGDLVGKVEGSTKRMRQLIDDLLTHALSRGKALRLLDIDLTRAVDETVAARGARGLVSHGRLPMVHADPVLLRQLLDNLLGNALKYVPKGVEPKISVRAEVRGEEVLVEIADNGIGLPEGSAARIFDEFYRVDRGTYAGTGLGLAICRRIVERHGGQIGARPNEGAGTVFEFTLPAAG